MSSEEKLPYLFNIINNDTAVEVVNFQESCCGLSYILKMSNLTPLPVPKMHFMQGWKPTGDITLKKSGLEKEHTQNTTTFKGVRCCGLQEESFVKENMFINPNPKLSLINLRVFSSPL